MVKVRPAEEKTLNELRDVLQDLQRALTPTTERFATIDATLRRQLLRLSAFDPDVHIAVIGARGSGKSTLVNALIGLDVIPQDTVRVLEVLPFVSPTPMLRRRQGKSVAAGEAGCRAHLESEKEIWVEELGDRRLHAPLPLVVGPHCCQNNWSLLDCPHTVTGLQPKLSSVATRIRTPNIHAADLFFYCVNLTWLGTSKESEILGPWIGDATDVQQTAKQRLLDHTVFVLSFADTIPEKTGDDGGGGKTLASSVAHFKALLAASTGGLAVDDRRLVLFSGRTAFHTKHLLMFEPSIAELYNYCELVFGAAFMQTIDDLDEDGLRHMVRKFANENMMLQSGGQRLTDLVRLFDYSCSAYLMQNVRGTAEDCVEQLQLAFVSAKPTISKEVEGLRVELDILVRQRVWIVAGLEEVTAFVETKMTEELVYVVQQQLTSFFAQRLEELRFVLEGRELVWFKSYQISTVVEMQSALRKLERFTATYVQQRSFLEAKVEKGDKSVGGWEFLDANTAAVLKAMQTEQQELVCNFCRRVSHHVKDEFDRCIGEMMATVSGKKDQLLSQFLAMVNPMLEQAELRLRRPCDIDTAVNIAADTQLLETNERRINNFLRELPEHVASAAVEIANQWFVPQSASETSSVACSAITSDGEGRRIDHNLLYVLEAWRLTFSSIEPYQLCKYNIHEATQTLQGLHCQAAEFLVSFVGELDAGICAVKDQIVEIEADGRELEEVERTVAPMAARLAELGTRLDDSLVWAVDVAAQRAVGEQETES